MNQTKKMRIVSILASIMLVLTLLVPMPMAQAASSVEEAVRTSWQPLTDEQRAALQAQVKLSQQTEPTLHERLQKIVDRQDKGSFQVIVHLSEYPTSVARGVAQLENVTYTSSDERRTMQRVKEEQQRVKQSLKKRGIDAQWTHTFQTVLNGFSMKVDATSLSEIMKVRGVTYVEPDVVVEAFEEEMSYETSISMIDTPAFLGAEALWKKGINGKGVKVAVLDTGIDANHPDLKPVYKGGKNFIPHDETMYRTKRADDDASETSPDERAPEASPEGFETTHGTHVAGTIAAQGKNKYNVKGIAPGVDLYAYRVLGAYGSGYTSNIIAAIDESVKEGMDVINLSLGGGVNTEIDASSFAINNAAMQGVTAVIATGNSGAGRETMGTPSTAPLGIAVGNSTKQESTYEAKVKMTASDVSLDVTLPLMLTTIGQKIEQQLPNTLPLVAINGVGTKEDFAQQEVKGKVAVVVRGDIPFFEKMENAREAGAKGIIIYNSENGTNAPDIADVNLGSTLDAILTFDMSYTDGQKLHDALQKEEGTFTLGEVKEERTDGDEMAPSSSRGPSIPNFDIKPDVVAPGSNIISTVPVFEGNDYAKAYEAKTGTSMATPHVAGVAALLLQKHPEWTPQDVKIAMSNTATLLDTKQYDVFDQGAGRVAIERAVDPELFVYTKESAQLTPFGDEVTHRKGTMTFNYTNATEVKRELYIDRPHADAKTYRLEIDPIRNDVEARSYLNIDHVKVDQKNGAYVTMTVRLPENAVVEDESEYLGYVRIFDGTKEVASVPFAVDFNGIAPTKIGYFGASSNDLAVNDNTRPVNEFVYYNLTAPVGLNYIEVIDLRQSDVWSESLKSLGYVHHSYGNGEGTFDLAWDGTYIPWDQKSERRPLKDGVYMLAMGAEPLSNRPANISEFAFPLYVKSTPPKFKTLTYDEESRVVTGVVEDQYFDLVVEEEQLFSRGVDMNKKIRVTYTLQHRGKETELQRVDLKRDGTFSFELDRPLKKGETIAVMLKDATGFVVEQAAAGTLQQIDRPKEETKRPLRDVAQSFAEKEIQALYEKEVVFGDANGLFHTHQSITRGEFAVMLARSLQLEHRPFANTFKDVHASHTWAYGGIEALAREGIVKGFDNGTFAMNDPITRQEVATFIIRALEYEKDQTFALVAKPKPFRDDASIGQFAQDAVYKAAALHIVNGTGGYFLPTERATRAESTVMIYRMLQQ